MKTSIQTTAAGAIIAIVSAIASAGPYSSATDNTTAGAIDAGIAGFVGPDGNGVVSSNNYINPIFVGWATGYFNYLPSDSSWSGSWNDPTKALGAVTGDNYDIVSLGDRSAAEIASGVAAGQITLTFGTPIANGSGADFAVFENALLSGTSIFAELAYVEVSSDGVNFIRFSSDSLTSASVGAYGTIDPTDVYNLAGKHVNAYDESWGTPFDLETIASDPLVLNGTVDLNNITYVRLIDIAGNGSSTDSNGHAIYDAWLTWGSGGFDLEAVGVINTVPEPGTLALLAAGAAAMLKLNRKKRH